MATRPDRLFLDTGVLVAAVYERDRHHERALEVLAGIAAGQWSAVYTSDLVVAEALNFATARFPSAAWVRAMLDLVHGGEGVPAFVTDVLRVHAGRFAEARRRHLERFDAGLSFTDWSTLVLLDELGIGALATFDRGFDGWCTVVPGS